MKSLTFDELMETSGGYLLTSPLAVSKLSEEDKRQLNEMLKRLQQQLKKQTDGELK